MGINKKNKIKKKIRLVRPEVLFKKIAKCFFDDNDLIFNWRPDFLKNPKTGRNLEIDIFIKSIKTGIEVNGIHHQTIKQIYKDNIKKEVFKEKGHRLLSIDKIDYAWKLLKEFNEIKIIDKKKLRKLKTDIGNTQNYYKNNANIGKTKYWQNMKRIIRNEEGVLEATEAQRKETEFNRKKMAIKKIANKVCKL